MLYLFTILKSEAVLFVCFLKVLEQLLVTTTSL